MSQEIVPVPFLERLKMVREVKGATDRVRCDNPKCAVILTSYPRSSPRFCDAHNNEARRGGIPCRFTASDLAPDGKPCSRTRCTTYLMEDISEHLEQFLFSCDVCKKEVCVFCAKGCHDASHTFSDVNYRNAICGRTQLLEIKRCFVVKEWGTDGKCAKNEVID